jgi:hypothetical protein
MKKNLSIVGADLVAYILLVAPDSRGMIFSVFSTW